MNWLRLIRWKNLLIVLFTQLVVWYCLIYDRYSFWGFTFQFIAALSLVASTVLIAAAGYIINDYFDVKIDSINRPGKVIIGNKITFRTAIVSHVVLNFLALVVAGILAAGHWEWLLMQFLCIGLLWFYSTHFKKQFITGNIAVALLAAFTVVVLQVYEPSISAHIRGKSLVQLASYAPIVKPVFVLYGYSFFAFMLTLIREIVKDIEDMEGDRAEGCNTMPIRLGVKITKRVVLILAVITIALLLLCCMFFQQKQHIVFASYLFVAVVLPLIIWSIKLSGYQTKEQFDIASKWLKAVMLTGLSSLIVYTFFH